MSDTAPQPLHFVSVKLTPVGRAQRFVADEGALSHLPRPGEAAVVETEQGPALGTVVPSVPQVTERRAIDPDGRRVVRLASHDDIVKRIRQRQREAEAYRVAQLKIRERGLEMRLTRVEQTFDGSRLVFFFTADGRVDFRELVRDLASHFHSRIELRQVGVRDEAKALGGYGTCGRPLCCTTFLTSFEPVSIKMAKQQDLSLNPSKLSGLCGRLKCCLRYELPNGNGQSHAGCGSESGDSAPRMGSASSGSSGSGSGCSSAGCGGSGCRSGGRTCRCR